MTDMEKRVEELKALADKGAGPELLEAVRGAFIDLRGSTFLADHVGDVIDSLGWSYLEAALGVDPESCRYCAGTGDFCGDPCDCPEGGPP